MDQWNSQRKGQRGLKKVSLWAEHQPLRMKTKGWVINRQLGLADGNMTSDPCNPVWAVGPSHRVTRCMSRSCTSILNISLKLKSSTLIRNHSNRLSLSLVRWSWYSYLEMRKKKRLGFDRTQTHREVKGDVQPTRRKSLQLSKTTSWHERLTQRSD